MYVVIERCEINVNMYIELILHEIFKQKQHHMLINSSINAEEFLI